MDKLELNDKRENIISQYGKPDYSYISENEYNEPYFIIDVYLNTDMWDAPLGLVYKLQDSTLIKKNLE